MLNIFHNINVVEARDDTNQGQFRYAVNLITRYHIPDRWSLKEHIERTEYVIDTTENLYDCQLVAERMIKDANDRTRERRARIKFNDISQLEGDSSNWGPHVPGGNATSETGICD